MKEWLTEPTLTWWPKHIMDSIWWAGRAGIYRRVTIGPLLWYHKEVDGRSKFHPYDLRCNCCFVCSWILRLTIYPIMWLIQKVKDLNKNPIQYR